jgi:hypothetical protein
VDLRLRKALVWEAYKEVPNPESGSGIKFRRGELDGDEVGLWLARELTSPLIAIGLLLGNPKER